MVKAIMKGLPRRFEEANLEGLVDIAARKMNREKKPFTAVTSLILKVNGEELDCGAPKDQVE